MRKKKTGELLKSREVKRMAGNKSTNEICVGFVGNPNCGKTTLFNAFTGASLKVANWPGVTVERAVQITREDRSA